MKLAKGYILSVSSVGLLSVLLFSIFYVSPPANAASAYDTYINPINKLELRRQNYGSTQNCTTVDMSTNWQEVIKNTQSSFISTYHDNYGLGGDASSLATSFNTALASGSWAVYRYPEYNAPAGSYYDDIYVAWKESGQMAVNWDSSTASLTGYDHIVGMEFDSMCTYAGKPYIDYFQLNNAAIGLINNTTANSGQGWFQLFMSTNLSNTIPSGYEGLAIPNASTIDSDGDGLSLAQEIEQGTSDNIVDTDGDGISDYKESKWFTDRDAVFCHPTASPKVCAYPDPAKQDVYLEIDWMKNSATNQVFKPTDTQLGLVETMFANEDINLHIDTGQFGGGNELDGYDEYLPNYSVNNADDFYDYQLGLDGHNQNFATNRQNIWHYLIYGDHYSTADGNSDSTGWSEIMGTNVFIAGGALASLSFPANIDRAVAGTIAHELGHTLCLSQSHVYIEQGTDCVYGGIDDKSGQPPLNNPDSFYNLQDYKSVMNYRYQLTVPDDLGYIDYSHGTNMPADHDDWSAVKSHIGGFASQLTVYVGYGSGLNSQKLPKSRDGHIIAESEAHAHAPEPKAPQAKLNAQHQ